MIRDIDRSVTGLCTKCKDTFTVHIENQLDREVLEASPHYYPSSPDPDIYFHKCGGRINLFTTHLRMDFPATVGRAPLTT